MSRKVTPAALEALAHDYSPSVALIELDPETGTAHLMVRGREVAWSPAPTDGTALADQHIAEAKAAAGIGGGR